MLKEEELLELERLEQAATPGEWVLAQPGLYVGRTFIVPADWTGDHRWVCGDVHGYPNAQLIAAARNALPRLIAELRGARAEIERLRELLGGKGDLESAYYMAELSARRKKDRIDKALELLNRVHQTAGYISNSRLVSVRMIEAIRAALTGEGRNDDE